MPSDFSLVAEKADMPSISEIGYVMMLGIEEGASGKLAQPRCPRDDLAHAIRSDLVSAEPEKFAGDLATLSIAST